MTETTTYTAVLDRFEGNLAVVFYDDDPETPVDIERRHFPRRKPKDGTYLKIEKRGDEVISITIDKEATKAARKRIQEKLERLRRGDHLQDPPTNP